MSNEHLRRPLSDAEKERILALREGGMTRRATALTLGRDERLVRAFLNSLPPPPAPPEPPPNPRGQKWWEPLPPGHPIAAAELERAWRLEL
jgi:transposase